jgi:tRNA nucleotidyltransferase/poly(A) polymerase
MIVNIKINGKTKTEAFDMDITIEGTPKEVKKAVENMYKMKKNINKGK